MYTFNFSKIFAFTKIYLYHINMLRHAHSGLDHLSGDRTFLVGRILCLLFSPLLSTWLLLCVMRGIQETPYSHTTHVGI